jgi:dolichol-phosphate mannosyltransferase
MQVLGFAVSGASLTVAFGYAVWRLLSPERFPSGFATLTISIWFLAGVQLLFLGIVGEYLARTFDESRRRPVAIVREIVAAGGSDAATAD